MVLLKTTLAAAALAAMVQRTALTPDNQPVEPFRIAGNLYYVGSSDIGSYLIATPEGHVLIDAGYVETAPQIVTNLGKLGFKIQDVKILLNTQAHFDHAAGFAELKRLSGARMMASDEDAVMLERGGHGDFNLGDSDPFPPVAVDRRLKDGDEVRLGGAVLTAHLTPGHTKGCTTWTFDVADGGRAYHVVDLCGLTVLPGTRVSGMPAYPTITSDYEHTFRTLKALPCDIFIGAHASYYGGAAKAAHLRENPGGPNPFVDPDGYRRFVDHAERRFRDQLARERR